MPKNQSNDLIKYVTKNKKLLAVIAASIFILALATSFGLNISYSAGSQGPSASFTSISGLNPSGAVSGNGAFKWNNPTDLTNWNIAYQVGGTSLDVTPTDSTGNVHSQLIGEMGGIGFSNGQATQPTETYSWNLTNPVNGDTEIYEMALYPLTWTINLATSTRNYEHLYYYMDDTVNMQIALNPDMWYFSSQPTNTFFGISDIELTNFTVVNTQTNAKTAIIPSALYSLLTITSPTNGESAAQAFYSYEGQNLNPLLFAPSVTTSLTISDLAPTATQDLWTGQWGGQDASVHMVFQVDTLVVGEWTVTPTFHGTGGTITPQQTKNPANWFSGLLSGLESALLNNPLASFLILLVIAGVGIVILIVVFPELAKALSGAASKGINKRSGKG